MVAIRYPGTYIRFVRLDGERALGTKFQEFAKNKGIIVERTTIDTLAQNSNTERAGGMITSIARTVRIYANLPLNLWPKAIRTARYLLNRLLTE